MAGVWGGTWSRVRCIGGPSAVCASLRTHVVSPVAQVHAEVQQDQSEFVTWLRGRGEDDACSALTVGMSTHGRALFATRPIEAGERVLRVSGNLIITPDKLPMEVLELLPKGVSEWARLALFLLAEQHIGQASEWAPYIRCLPPYGSLHSTIFWKKEEMEMVRYSSVHRETLQRKAVIGAEFASVLPVLQQCPHIFGDQVTHASFKHAYATDCKRSSQEIELPVSKGKLKLNEAYICRACCSLNGVCSRAWGIEALQTLALVPFVDFFNHDAECQALLSYDEEKACAEVVADRNYAAGAQVFISYGRLPNTILALDFGFTLPFNPHDQVEVWMGLSRRDPLRKSKLSLLHTHGMPTLLHTDGSDSGGNSFHIREVKSVIGRGKGIPHALRAFARVLCATSTHELTELGAEAGRHDGRLARRPLKSCSKETQAMNLLLARFESLIHQHSIAALQIAEACRGTKQSPAKKKPNAEMASDVVAGELRVLYSAAAWIRHHYTSISVLTTSHAVV